MAKYHICGKCYTFDEIHPNEKCDWIFCPIDDEYHCEGLVSCKKCGNCGTHDEKHLDSCNWIFCKVCQENHSKEGTRHCPICPNCGADCKYGNEHEKSCNLTVCEWYGCKKFHTKDYPYCIGNVGNCHRCNLCKKDGHNKKVPHCQKCNKVTFVPTIFKHVPSEKELLNLYYCQDCQIETMKKAIFQN